MKFLIVIFLFLIVSLRAADPADEKEAYFNATLRHNGAWLSSHHPNIMNLGGNCVI